MAKTRRIRSKIQKQAGGYLEGPSHEEGGIPAYTPGSPPIELEGGEYIINAATTATLGTDFLDKLNRTQSPHHSQPGFGAGVLPGSNYKGGGHVRKMEYGGRSTMNTRKSNRLPESYRKSNEVGKFCGNCLFVRNNYCKKWSAGINHKFLCKSWNGSKQIKITKRGEL